MYDPGQKVKIKWNSFYKKHYIQLGYEFTKIGDIFEIKAKDLFPNSTTKIKAICDYCGKHKETSFLAYNQNTEYGKTKYTCGCKKCTEAKRDDLYGKERKEKRFQKFIDKCKSLNYKPISIIDNYINGHSEMYYECSKHGIKSVDFSNFIYSNEQCRDCAFEKLKDFNKLSIDDVINKVESKNNNKIINPEDYINMNTKNLKIVCGICKETFISSLASLENGDGACRDCSILKSSKAKRLKPEKVKSIIESVNGNILLNPDEYINNHELNLRIQCQCGNVFITNLSNYTTANKTRCDYCSKRISSGELLIKDILDKYNIYYIPEYIFEDCKDKRALPFDFYLPYYNCCIEFDGITHFEPIYGDETFEIRIKHDRMKDQYCHDNQIKIIRIPYFESDKAEKILIKELIQTA